MNLIIGAKLKVHLLGTVRWVGLVWLVSALAPKTEIGHLKKAGRKHQVCIGTTHEVEGLIIGLCGAGIMTL